MQPLRRGAPRSPAWLTAASLFALASCAASKGARPAGDPSLLGIAGGWGRPDEPRLKDVRRVTVGGQNAEAYWSFDGRQLIYQSRPLGDTCDVIYRIDPFAAKPAPIPVSDGKGATTCAYFLPGDQQALWASTHLGGAACPPKPDRSKGYVWALYDRYDIFKANLDGSAQVRLTDAPGYDAEATVCAKDGSIVFTSVRDGDLELYRMDKDGRNVRRLTRAPGYDGGAFFSPDCSQIVWRASRPRPGPELEQYQELLKQGLVRPSKLELWVANADGSDAHQITWLDAASFAPFFHPSGRKVIFSSNFGQDPKSGEFDLWMVDVDGTHLERVTTAPGFDGFPMFSPDGRWLAFASNRSFPKGSRETDVFVARWDEDAQGATLETAADRIRADIAWLADPAREGRGVGTRGLDAAGVYLEQRLEVLGLAPAGAGLTFRQSFDLPVSAAAAPGTAVALDGRELAASQFTPIGASASADVAGDLVFAGYGIRAPGLALDDWARVDARGRIAVVRRFSPDLGALDTAEQRRAGDLRGKAWLARERGAKALIVVDLPERPRGAPADWKMPEDAGLSELIPGADVGIPVVVLTREAGAPVIERLRAHKRVRGRVAVKLSVSQAPVFNVLGRIEAGAERPLPGVVVLGAHYDHLGYGGPDSLDPDSHAPHLGADDNASGVAAVLEAARALQDHRSELRRDVIVALFTGEEKGTLGSTQLTRAPPAFAMADVVGLLNLDMVGRLGQGLTVLGAETAAEWRDLLRPACEQERVDCAFGGDGYGPSDQMPFYLAGVPGLHLFTGGHADYHKPSDSVEKIHAAGAAAVSRIASAGALALAAREARLTFNPAPAPPPRGDLRTHRAGLGVIPDYSGKTPGDVRGLLLSGVRRDGPAERAGLRRGDVLVKLGPYEIGSPEDLMMALQASKAGETAQVRVLRDGKPESMTVTFGEGRGR